MSEISIVIPLSAIQGADTMSPTDLAAFLADSISVREELGRVINDYNSLVESYNSAGNNLQLILDELDGFERVQALRAFVESLRSLRRMKKVTGE